MADKLGQQKERVVFSQGQLTERVNNAILWGGVIVVAFVAAFGFMFLRYVPSRIDSQVSPKFDKVDQRLAKVEQRLTDIEDYQKEFLPSLLQNLIKKSASTDSRTQRRRLALADAALNTARETHAVSNPERIVTVGRLLLGQNPADPQARRMVWKTFVDLVSYRSALASAPLPPSVRKHHCIKLAPGASLVFSASVLEGCTQALDHGVWKGVVFRNDVITYSGGAATLEGVRFDNCEFRIAQGRNGRELGEALLASNEATVRLP